ncbi:flagellar basal body P-ring protein FlgI [Limisphaera ngatamarikiensis]|uniref:Flagellar P-ring protein n=1 Tax=Limisphaera ngatamarikiensis TaxID=1324935 RepID=A0A6M1RVF4_9BACT|nr:flagellar basal body P-ring protein FlgI [Limisphaera ngatamarikiensis]NGO39391.1 flagellar basal body P-ring protein FlgI [Limisphaera ngatamarikiensis]
MIPTGPQTHPLPARPTGRVPEPRRTEAPGRTCGTWPTPISHSPAGNLPLSRPGLRWARKRWTRWCTATLLGLLLFFSGPLTVTSGAAGVRVRDLAMIAGARDNQLVGFGLVVGLAGDGDKDPVYTKQTIANMLQRYGINVPPTTLSAKNVAVVMVTADIPPFAKPGTRIDVQVASMGDAKSLQGGVLLQTPLLGADNRVYAVAQGPVAVGGFTGGQGGAGGATVTKNHPTVGTIIGGALVEREIPAEIVRDNAVELLLREPDFTTASRIAAAINNLFTNRAEAVDATTVRVTIPESWRDRPVDFIARLEAVEVQPEVPARIIINERTGTIVATSRIRISPCAISHGNITINVASTLNVSQPNPLGAGTTVVTPSTTTEVTENKAGLVPLPELPTVEQVASALNSLGVTPRDMMAIFQALKQAGALQAELVIR